MKNKKHLFFGTLIMGMAFASVLAGCATPGGSETSPTPDEQAVQLAADLNAIKAGSAVVDGAKVTLSGEVRLTTSLNVPAGVTLDLTKEALQLGDNAVLTVNGAVDAKAEGINVDSVAANPALINGSGTIHLKSKGWLLGIWEGRKITLDGVTLVGIEDNDNSLVQVGEGGEFVLKSGAITGNTLYKKEGWPSGGGVGMWKGGTFTMEGGTISGNTVQGIDGASGGGVGMWLGTFIMKDGTISDNAAIGKEDSNGGGVYAVGTFTMEGGTISGNTANNGGGVAVWAETEVSSTFTMKGGAISGNTAAGEGGGVKVSASDDEDFSGTFIMEGGVISGNTAGWGGGVQVSQSAFTLKGGRIQGSTDSDGFTKNTASGDTDTDTGSMNVYKCRSKWGTGGTYTKGGVAQTSDSDIFQYLFDKDWDYTGDTLIAIPAP